MCIHVVLLNDFFPSFSAVVFLVGKYSGSPKNIILQGNHSNTKKYSLCQTTVEHEENAHS